MTCWKSGGKDLNNLITASTDHSGAKGMFVDIRCEIYSEEIAAIEFREVL